MVSILVPVFNAEKYIEECLTCLCTQTYSNLEILLCDDGSTDNTLYIVKEFIRKNSHINFYLYENVVNQGYLKTCNFLATKATGDYITFQDADDKCTKDRVEKLVNHLQSNALDIVGSNIYIFTGTKNLSHINYPSKNDEIYKYFLNKSHPPFCGSAVLLKSELIKRHGLYDIKFNRLSGEDYDWLYRLALENYKMGNIHEALYGYRQHSTGVSKMNFKGNILALYSGYIAKDLYLARLNGEPVKDFDYFAQKYKSIHEKNPEAIYYRELQNSYLSNDKKEIFHSFNKFLFNTKKTPSKYKLIIMTLMVLTIGNDRVENLKKYIR